MGTGAVGPLNKECGRRLRDLREDLGFSQADLGLRIGRSQPSIARWERGHTEPDLATRHLLASVLGKDVYAIEQPAEQEAASA